MTRPEARSFINIVLLQFREDLVSWLSFATLLTWMFGMYWSDTFANDPSGAQFGILHLRALWLATEAVALLVMLAASRPLLRHVRATAAVAGTLLFVGTLLFAFAPALAPFEAARMWGSVLAGAGCGGFLALIGVSLASRGPRILLIDVALALATASLMDALLLVLPPTLKPMAVSLMPVVGIALFAASKNPSPSPPRRDAPQHRPARLGVVRTVALPLAVGLAYGLMQRLVGDVYAADGMGASAATVASFFLSSLIIAVSALFSDSRALIKLICFVAIPLIGVAFVMLPLFSDGLEAAQSICIVGFNSFYFMVWALWTSDAQGARLPTRFIAGLLVLVGAESLGSVLGSGIAPNVADSDASLAIVCLVVVYLLLMAGMLSFDRGQVAARREQQRQEGAAPVGTRAFPPRQENSQDAPANARLTETRAELERLAERFQLSARETQVFELLAKGRNREHISKTLFISDNTTRTHMKNVYRKLDVHSQQELIDLLEASEKQDPKA